jgi:osmotically-inducible protein OsmY
MKLTAVRSIPREAAMSGPGKEMVDVRLFRVSGGQEKTVEKIRHELAMMPYLTEYDFISFSFVQGHVILSGWTLRDTNRSTAENLVKRMEAVEKVTNNIEVLPLGRNDMQIRQAARAALQRHLARYFWGSGSDIKIIVKNGDIILLGTVQTQADSDLATMQCSSVPLSFHVFNMLRVAGKKNSKS